MSCLSSLLGSVRGKYVVLRQSTVLVSLNNVQAILLYFFRLGTYKGTV
jgi:hypothetical protein